MIRLVIFSEPFFQLTPPISRASCSTPPPSMVALSALAVPARAVSLARSRPRARHHRLRGHAAPAVAATSSNRADDNAAEAQAWIDAWSGAGAGSVPTSATASDADANAASAQEWIDEWQKGGDDKATAEVDWEAKTREMTAERVLEQCLEAMADGDEDRLEACLLELDTPAETKSVIDEASKRTDDQFWKDKLAEIAAERVLDNCMAAVMSGDADEIEACMLDANNDTLIDADFTTAEDGTVTFRF